VNIQTGGSTAPLTVDSSQKVDNLNSDQLDGLHANELGRLAFNHFVFPTVPNPGGTVASTTITTSQPQELVDVNASFYIYSFDTTAANFPCQPLFTLSLDGGSLDTYLPFNIATPSPGTSVYDVSTGQTAQLVGPGVHTVGLVYGGYINPRYCSFSIGKGTLRAQSWQFAGDGSAPASSARASTRSKTPGLTK
jgi:hypothetical protein